MLEISRNPVQYEFIIELDIIEILHFQIEKCKFSIEYKFTTAILTDVLDGHSELGISSSFSPQDVFSSGTAFDYLEWKPLYQEPICFIAGKNHLAASTRVAEGHAVAVIIADARIASGHSGAAVNLIGVFLSIEFDNHRPVQLNGKSARPPYIRDHIAGRDG